MKHSNVLQIPCVVVPALTEKNCFHNACILIKIKVLFVRFVFPTDLGIFRNFLVLFWGFLELHL